MKSILGIVFAAVVGAVGAIFTEVDKQKTEKRLGDLESQIAELKNKEAE